MAPQQLQQQYSNTNTRAYQTLTTGSDYQAEWKCEKGHTYKMRYSSRIKGQNCPYCANKKVLPGYNDLATTHPELSREWHPTLNGNLTPQNFTYGSGQKIQWVCDRGHEWEAKISNRTYNKTNCPYCTNKKVLPGYNDLATTHPELSREWHPTLNGNLTPQNFTKGSRKKVWWLGECGHEWETQIHARTLQNTKCPQCLPQNNLPKTHAPLIQEWSKKNTILPDNYSYGSEQKVLWVCDKGHEWEAKIRNRTAGKGCPTCASQKYVSKTETVLQQYIKSLGLITYTNTRSIIAPYELDILIPDRNTAIEFNGLYWHSEANGKGKTYHYDKWKACQEQGIQLIQVWEDDWNRNPELVKRMLAHKLGVSSEPRVYARKLEIREVSYNESKMFLTQNHIQGPARGTIYLGGFFNSTLMLICVLVSRNNIVNISRYATSSRIPGGFSKMLKYVERTYTPESIVTFSDNMVSDGGLYKNNGFIPVKELKPDYSYVRNGVREHKFGYRLKRFRNDPVLQYVEGLTEKELAQLNGLPRVWDAGKTKWVKNV